jgi:CRISPR system Cascade subunit CasB
MTTTTEAADETYEDRSSTRRHTRRRGSFGGHVAATVQRLQRDYRDRRSSAVAAMAQLRAASRNPPGYDYAVLESTLVPEAYLGRYVGDEATDTEHAKHTAVTLYALHQQSVYDRPMHMDGESLGAAVSLLSRQSPSSEAVRRRFAALGTASAYEESVHHLRALVRQLRDQKIGLDYGLLAEDLVQLRRPGGRTRVQALWGRDFYRAISNDSVAPNKE